MKRFYSKIDRHGPYPTGPCLKIYPWLKNSRCHLWTGYCDSYGYGHFRYEGTMKLAHRVMNMLKHGKLPKRIEVCHYCDNTSCINDDHLFRGTHKQNVHDMRHKGRAVDNKGSSNGRAKLNESAILKIRKLYATGEYTQERLGKEFGVDRSMISYIILGKTWGHV